jgi:Tfp pilus assembly protein PilV
MLRFTGNDIRPSAAAGFSLVELTLALGIAAFCLIAVFGLVPIAVQTNRNATSQTAATNILADVVADIRATARATASATPSQLYSIAIPPLAAQIRLRNFSISTALVGQQQALLPFLPRLSSRGTC